MQGIFVRAKRGPNGEIKEGRRRTTGDCIGRGAGEGVDQGQAFAVQYE